MHNPAYTQHLWPVAYTQHLCLTCIYGLLRSLWSTASSACSSTVYNSYDALVSGYTGGTVNSSQTGSATGSGADDLLECPDPLLKV